ACGGEGARHARHGAADDVGGRTPDRGGDGRVLEITAHTRVLGVDLGVVDAPAEYGFDVAAFVRTFARRIHIGADAGEAFEVGFDVGRRLVLGDAELVGEREGGEAVDDAEVDRLGAPAHL